VKDALFIFLLALLAWGAALAVLPARRRRAASPELELAVGMHPASRTTLPALREPTEAELHAMGRWDWDQITAAIADCEESHD
jgi:hypothetical protein